ncbi:pilus assembly protein PilM [Zhongshania sp.]|uniref:pilus assembly protein PilM n=3 Tax=Zhongshania sp. TaxID=1971902 RepID=UPI003567D540
MRFLNKLPRWSSARNSYSAIGLELMDEAVNLVQFSVDDGVPRASAAATVVFDGGREDLIASPERLKQLLKPVLAKDFKGTRVHSCLPPEYFKLMYVNYRLNKAQNEAEAITNQMRERLTGDLADYVIDYLPVRTQSSNAENLALVSVSPRDAVIRYLEFLRKAGLTADALEIGPVALNRLLAVTSSSSERDNHLSITFGQEKTYLSVHSGRRLLLDREVALGEVQVIDQLCQALEVDQAFAKRMLYRELNLGVDDQFDAQALLEEHSDTLIQILKPLFVKLVDEINRAMSYTASQTRGEPIRHIFLLGSAAHWPLAGHLLSTLVKIPVHVLYPIARYDALQKFLNIPDHLHDHCLAVASGLALRGLVLRGEGLKGLDK